MAKNRELKMVVESESESDSDSSSDNDKSGSTGSESDSSDSEPELKQTQTTKKKPTTPAAAKKPVQKSASKPSSTSASGSDSEPNPKGSPTPTLQNGSTKSRTKPAAADPVSSTRSAAQKRPAEEETKRPAEEETKPAKKAKKKAGPLDTPKKPLFQRFWLEDDDPVILQGMINYRDQKKSDPAADFDALHNFIKEDLNTKDSIASQLDSKIKRLKKKYLNNKKKEEKMKQDGKEMTFSKPLERAAYELSKSVWGTEVADAAKEANKRTKKVVAAAREDKAPLAETETAFRVKTMGATVDDIVFSIGVEMFENGKGDAAEVMEWKKLRLEEMQANLRVLEVKTALSKLVVERFKSKLL